MAKQFRVSLKGHKQVAAKMKALAIKYPAAAAVALNHEAEEVLGQAIDWTPVKTGRLKGTAKVQKTAKPKRLFARLPYGTNYALYVHEIPPGPKKPAVTSGPKKKKKPSTTKQAGPKAKRRAYHEPPTRWKFLEAAVLFRAKKFPTAIADEMAQIVGK